jgi:hypothetical protein
MRKLQTTIVFFLILALPVLLNAQIIQEFVSLDGNNIKAPFVNTGIFDQNITVNNFPGFEWPKGTNKYAIFTAGLTMGAFINGSFKMAAALYQGEYAPGYINNGQALTNSTFKLYKVKAGDNQFNNPDYANWGLMVPYGAPFTDVNSNGTYEAAVDKPGVMGAEQTIFLCMTDGFPEQHNSSEGFGGGTTPMYAEVHMTAWCYNESGLEDVQFIKWDIINKSGSTWNGAIFSIVSDPDLGDAVDDWIGCDKTLKMGYCYNSDNNDGVGSGTTYGFNPPAVGISFLKTPKNSSNNEYGLTSYIYFGNSGPGPVCEMDPNIPNQAYNFMKGLKGDGTPYVNAVTMNTTRHVFDGDPESGAGWTEFDGRMHNYGGDTTGAITPSLPGDRRMIMNTGDTLNNVNNGQMVTIVASQQIARGSNHLNAVTRLRALTHAIQNYWQTIGITPISSEVPASFRLHQNYPNPFNPSTKIRFEIPSTVRGQKSEVRLSVYDVSGKEVRTLVNSELAPGVYEYNFNGANLSSGMYFYRLEAGDFVETKKMVLVK